MAAAAVAVPLIEILISVAIAAGAGAGVLIAARLGSGDREGARRLFNTAAWMLGVGGLLVCVLGNLFLRPLARLLGASDEVLAPILSNTALFGVDLCRAGVAVKVGEMLREELAGPGAVRQTLTKYLKN